MRLSVSARFTLRDKPKGYLGLTGEYWSFGKDKSRTMGELAYDFLTVLFDWHLRWLTIDEANYEKQRLVAWLTSVEFGEARSG